MQLGLWSSLLLEVEKAHQARLKRPKPKEEPDTAITATTPLTEPLMDMLFHSMMYILLDRAKRAANPVQAVQKAANE